MVAGTRIGALGLTNLFYADNAVHLYSNPSQLQTLPIVMNADSKNMGLQSSA